MKLANALSQRSELQTRIRQLEVRLNNNALVQEGEQPAEDPMELFRELEEDYARLEDLVARINRTNNSTRTENGAALSDLLARRDCLKGRLGGLRNFLNNASAMVHRHSASEIRIKSTVNVRQLQKQVDSLAKELRELEETIQEKNWTTELL
ncbi:DIP1984 family protein [Flintibacter muris]|uniref:DIP1984 family protein n=1 Tax=Flintibacter muris TaxID=2941327 RepID=UPI00203C83C7|nr:DIP1984 family protein [Flintibacter muris]